MLERLAKLSGWFGHYRRLLLLLVAIGGAFIGWGLINPFSPQQEQFLLPCLVLVLWLLLAYIMTNVFSQIPEQVNKQQGLIKRIKLRIQRFFYWLLVIVFISLTLAVLVLTAKLGKIWFLS